MTEPAPETSRPRFAPAPPVPPPSTHLRLPGTQTRYVAVDLVDEVVPLPPLTPLPGAGPSVLGFVWVRDRIRLVCRIDGVGDPLAASGTPGGHPHLIVARHPLPCVLATGRIDLVGSAEAADADALVIDAGALEALARGEAVVAA
ncbi:hypothetical protein JQC91_09200 [Jannaschia sp. Os4]|uniref:hypothetical protein n=1 Tax=Jannaschia sp. Os4 TaxID=2807617 RepID=UPI001939DEC3|nr:hypothetical protein [Jannaschia sp. Os4]MBM2576483.1 hypothetical protein [Jannaschia sp. Os4]